MTRKKVDFKNPKEARKYIYKVIGMLEKGDIPEATANAYKSLVDCWLKAYTVETTEELEARVKLIEETVAARQK